MTSFYLSMLLSISQPVSHFCGPAGCQAPSRAAEDARSSCRLPDCQTGSIQTIILSRDSSSLLPFAESGDTEGHRCLPLYKLTIGIHSCLRSGIHAILLSCIPSSSINRRLFVRRLINWSFLIVKMPATIPLQNKRVIVEDHSHWLHMSLQRTVCLQSSVSNLPIQALTLLHEME